MRNRAWDGSAGVRVTAPWDGHGMQATQSHALAFDGIAATRVAWPGNWKALADAAGPFIGTIFTAVILGIIDEAVDCARQNLISKKDSLRAYEQVEWVRAEMEAWLAVQAYEGMLRAVESEFSPLRSVLRGKLAVSETRGVRSPQNLQGDGWRNLCPSKSLWLLVRRRSGAWFSSSAVGTRLRCPLRSGLAPS